MKKILLISIVWIISFSAVAQEEWWEPDTVRVYHSSNLSERWIYSYNNAGMKTGKTTEKRSVNVWILNEEVLWSYDQNKNMLSKTERRQDSIGQTVNYRRWLFTYNDRNMKETETLEYWNREQWTVDIVRKMPWEEEPYVKIWTYDDNANLLAEIQQVWSSDSLGWANYLGTFCTYDEQGNLLTKIANQGWNGNQWINLPFRYGSQLPSTSTPTVRYEYTYDERNNQLMECRYGFDRFENDWVYFACYRKTYDLHNNLLSETTLEPYSNDILSESFIITYTYNENNDILTHTEATIFKDVVTPTIFKAKSYDINYNPLSTLIQQWTNNRWQDLEYYTSAYDENGNCEVATAQIWRGGWRDENVHMFFIYNNSRSRSEPLICNKVEISYVKVRPPTRIPELPLQEEILFYPNPTKGELRIDKGELRIDNVAIYDLLGRIQKSKIVNLKSEIVIDVSHLPAGVYFVQLSTEKGAITKKVMKQ